MLLSVLFSTMVSPAITLAEEVGSQLKTEEVDKSEVREEEKAKSTESKAIESTESSEIEVPTGETLDPSAKSNDSPNESEANKAEQTVLADESAEKEGETVDLEKIEQLANRPFPDKYNTSGLNNAEIEQLGLAIFGEVQPAGTSTQMKNDKGEDVNIPFQIKRQTREIGNKNSFNMSYVLTGFGTTSRYPVISHHYVGSQYAFCIDPNTLFVNGSNYVSQAMDISNQTYKNINDVLNFGAQDASNDVESGYTQLLVWSRIGWDVTEVSGIGSLAGFQAYQAKIESKMQQWYAKASFHDQTVNLRVGESVTLTDSNNSVNGMDITSNNTGATVTKSGNKVTIKATNITNSSGTVWFGKKSPLSGTALIWTSPGSQSCTTGGKLDPDQVASSIKINIIKQGDFTLQKVNDAGAAMAGVTFELTYNGKTITKTTDKDGKLSVPGLDVGTKVEYKETKTIAGHYIDAATAAGSVTIKEGANPIKVTNPRYANLTLIKKNDAGVNMEGVTFKLMYDGKTETVKTNKDGQIKVVNTLKAGTKVDWEETATIAGHYIDPATAKGSITVKSGENTINVKNPRYADLVLHKVNDKGEDMEGVVFKFKVGDQEFEKTTDSKGNIAFKNEFKSGTVVAYEEIKTLKGHYIDPATAKGSITVKSGDNAIEVKNPCLDFLISSQATNKDGAKFVNPAKGQALKDEVKVEAKSAPVGAKLRLTSNFVEFGTGEALSEQDMKTVEEFDLPEGHSTVVHAINNEFDATGLNGKKGVYTQVLDYFNPSTNEWEEVARADDVNDENEAIQIVEPKIKTKLFFFDHKEKEVKLTDPLSKVKGYDLVEYENLISGDTYTFDLTMMVPSGEKFVDPLGKEVTGQIVIVAGVDGEITSTMDAQEYYNKKATEEADKDADKEGEKDADKEAQKETDQKDTKEADKTPDVGTGKETDKEEEEPQEVQTEFSDIAPVTLVNGSVKVPFEINLSAMAGKAVVAYEVLSTNDTPVTDHENPGDKDQTGHIRNPKLNTKALANGKKEITEDGKIILEDEVEYFDLTPGVEYEQDLVWMVKNTGEALKLKQKEVTGTIKFTPEKENGTVTVKVEIDGNDLFEKYGDTVDLVAFETTKRDGEVVTEHKNINDIGQTVRIIRPVTPVVPTTGRTTLPQTAGTLGSTTQWILLALVVATGAIFIFMNKNRQSQKD